MLLASAEMHFSAARWPFAGKDTSHHRQEQASLVSGLCQSSSGSSRQQSRCPGHHGCCSGGDGRSVPNTGGTDRGSSCRRPAPGPQAGPHPTWCSPRRGCDPQQRAHGQDATHSRPARCGSNLCSLPAAGVAYQSWPRCSATAARAAVHKFSTSPSQHSRRVGWP